MVPGPSAASSTAERVPTTDVSISDRILRVTSSPCHYHGRRGVRSGQHSSSVTT